MFYVSIFLHLRTACKVFGFAHILDLNDGIVVLIGNQFKRPVLEVVLNNLVMELASDESFCVKHGVLRVRRDLSFRCLSNQSVSFCEGNDGRSCPISHIVRNNLHSVIFPYSDAGISKDDLSKHEKHVVPRSIPIQYPSICKIQKLIRYPIL